MRDEPCGAPDLTRRGFTLIEVIAAMVIFSVGVLMVLQLTGALSDQMEYAAKTSEVVARAQERLDSIESVSFTALTLGTQADTVTIRGVAYRRTLTISSLTAVLYQLDVAMAPLGGVSGPTFSATSYSAAEW